MSNTPVSELYLVLDQGTSSSKVFLFNTAGEIVFTRRERHALHKPAPFHVESDGTEILNGCIRLMTGAVNAARQLKGLIVSAGLAVQRSTFLFWDKTTGQPLTPAISWQDSRSSKEMSEISDFAGYITEQTGAPLSSHFGGPKFMHLVRNSAAVRKAVKNKSSWFGPLSSFLSTVLTGNPAVDESIAGRSLLVPLKNPAWSRDLCDIFEVPLHVLPDLAPTLHEFGNIRIGKSQFPLKCVIGDQQAALVGQGGVQSGDLAMNFGTSGSVQFNAGEQYRVTEGLLSSVLFSSQSERFYILEGTINSCNALFYWMEDELKIPHREMVWHKRCDELETEGYFLPGFAGIAAPYWKEGLQTVSNVNPENRNEYIRAGMESIGYLVNDILCAIKKNNEITASLVSASGGGARKPLLQFIADLTGLRIGHSTLKDRTAYGVFDLLVRFDGKPRPAASVQCDDISTPMFSKVESQSRIRGWRSFLAQNGVAYSF